MIVNDTEFLVNFTGKIKTLFNKSNISYDTDLSKTLNHRELFYLYNFILEKYSIDIDFMDYKTPQQIASLITNG